MNNALTRRLRKNARVDCLFRGMTRGSAIFLLLLFCLLILFLFRGSWPALSTFGFKFLISSTWNPVTQQFGAFNLLIGTLVSTFIALCVAIPISVGCAVFVVEMASSYLSRPFRIFIELLAAIPSIIYGMWGLFVFAPLFGDTIQRPLITHLANIPGIGSLFQGAPLGLGLLSAGIILGIMISPFITAIMSETLLLVPALLKESAYGLGATRGEVIRYISLPYARAGLLGGVTLGLGRALGETMAVAFVIGNSHNWASSLLMPANSLTATLANEFSEAVGRLYISSLMECGFILLILTLLIFLLSQHLLRWMKNKT
jgi:phosphate transport system permease protein